MHGAAISLITSQGEFQSITKPPGASQSEYLLNHDSALYMKYATEDADNENRWMFWFTPEHQEAIKRLSERYRNRTFIVLICYDEWVCILSYDEYRQCLDENQVENEWIEVTRPDGGGFRVRGKKDRLSRIIPLNAFPRILFERNKHNG